MNIMNQARVVVRFSVDLGGITLSFYFFKHLFTEFFNEKNMFWHMTNEKSDLIIVVKHFH